MGFGRRIKHLYHRVDYSTGKKLFGNATGVKNNLTGSLKKAQGGSSIEIGEGDPRINELRAKQHIILNNQYDEKLIEIIRSKYNELIENDEKSYVTGTFEGKCYSRHITRAHEQIKELAGLLTDEIKEIVKGYYQGKFNVRYLGVWRNYHVPKEIQAKTELFSNNWHCDNRSTEYLKLFITLEDITEDDGPFHIMSQQRTKELMKLGYGTRVDYNLADEVINDPNHVTKITGKAGIAYLANPQLCLHRAGNPSKSHKRDVILFVFGPSSELLSDNWLENYKQDENYYKASNEK